MIQLHKHFPQFYTLFSSLRSTSGSQYTYEAGYSNYTLSVTIETSIDEIMTNKGLVQPLCELAINGGGDGHGTVTSHPVGINCGSSCSQSFVCNSDLAMLSMADNQSLFTGWSGDCSGASLTTFVSLDGDLNCTATFVVDFDQDGMPDEWENRYGLDTSVDDSLLDADNDGINNITEYHDGTPPDKLVGDINDDGSITLADSILCLMIIGGMEPAGVNVQADVNGDNRIGLEEAIHALNIVSKTNE